MEIHHACVPGAEDLWRRISGPFELQEPLAIVMSLLRQCICWMFIFLAFHFLKLFFDGRRRQARTKKLSEDWQRQSDSERKGVEQLCVSHILSSPTAATNGGAALETPPKLETQPLVPVSMCVADDSCGDILDDRRLLLDAASQLHAPGEEVTELQACAGPVVQTKLTRLEPASLCFGDTINTPSTTAGKVAAVKRGKSILIQLGRWRCFRTSGTGNSSNSLRACYEPFLNCPSRDWNSRGKYMLWLARVWSMNCSHEIISWCGIDLLQMDSRLIHSPMYEIDRWQRRGTLWKGYVGFNFGFWSQIILKTLIYSSNHATGWGHTGLSLQAGQ